LLRPPPTIHTPRVLGRWYRLMVAFAAAFAVWAIATPAYAAAPLCDPHGATSEAPAPQLQEPATSIDLGITPECEAFSSMTSTFDHGRAPAPTPSRAAPEPLVPSVMERIALAAGEESFARDGVSGSARAEARSRVDRPPRG
jgi:hypothetical protein